MLITLIWGGTFPAIRDSLPYISPNTFVTYRFLLAALIMLPFVLPRLKRLNWQLVTSGAILGLLNGAGYYGQTIGLKTISSAQSAFITSTTVIIVPFLAPLFKLGRPHWFEIIGAVVCLYGIYILTGKNLAGINMAELSTLLCALTTALGILYLQYISDSIDDFVLFAFMQILFSSLVPLTVTAMRPVEFTVHWNLHLIIGLVYCASLATTLTFFLQSRYQQYTTPTKAGIIFTMEPVFASVIAYLINDETLSRDVIFGGGIVLASLLLTEFKHLVVAPNE